MNLLAIDTSGNCGSVAIAKESQIVYLHFQDIKVTQSERVMLQIDNALKETKLTLQDLNAIVYANGPGSFTGVRIGLATVKGLCMANTIPLIPVNSLRALAESAFGSKTQIVPIIDAKMGEVYTALYTPKLVEVIPPHNTKFPDFLLKIDCPFTLIGNGITDYLPYLGSNTSSYQTLNLHQSIPLASQLLSIIIQSNRIPPYDFDYISTLEPYYLRLAQAQILQNSKNTQ